MNPPSVSAFILFLLLIPVALTPPSPEASPPPFSNQLVIPEGHGRAPLALPAASSRAPAGRSPLSIDADENGRFLLASLDGTLYSVDERSKVIQWKLPTGSPLWHSEQALSNNDGSDYFIYHDEDWNLFEYTKDVGARKLNLTVEELVRNTPLIKGSVVTVGSRTTSIYYVDADSGEVLSQDYLPGSSPAVVVPGVGEKSDASRNSSFIMTIIRTNYFLTSSDLGKPLWSLSTSRFTAHINHKSYQINLPVFFPTKGGNLAKARSPLESPIVGLLPDNSREIEKGHSTGVVPSAQGNIIEASLLLGSQIKDDKIRSIRNGKYMPESSIKSQNICQIGNFDAVRPNAEGLVGKFTSSAHMMLPYNQGLCFSTLQNSSKGAPSNGIVSKVLPWLMIFPFFILFRLCYLMLRKLMKSDKQLSDMGVQQSVPPKKRKSRKAGNPRNGSGHDMLKSSDEEKAETKDERNPFINLTRDDNTSDGRRIGRLYVSNSEIGRGSNGTVVLKGSYDGREVAVKRLLRAHNDVASKEIANLIASDWHSNIVRLYGVEQDTDFIYISLELCTCSLSDLIQLCSDSSSHMTSTDNEVSISISNHRVRIESLKNVHKNLELWRPDGFPSPLLLKLMRDVVSGLAHLHELGIIHRDLKPQNVLISNDRSLNAKVSDMGISKRLLEDMSSLSHHATGHGSAGWQAPEQLLNERQTRAVDLFSLGCILFFCITKGKHPFGKYFERDSNIFNNRIDLFLVDDIPEAVHLLSHLLVSDPKKRLTAVEVLNHPFFWSSELRLSFLRDTSDRVELEDREIESELLKELENIGPVAFDGKWNEKLDGVVIADISRYRKYKFDSTRDLLRVIRNKLNHFRELPKELQEILGAVPEGFDRYFARRFPKLLIEVYKVVSRFCKEEDSFHKYFKGSLL